MEISNLFIIAFNVFGTGISYLEAAVFSIALITFIVQMYYYLGRYGDLHRYRNNRGKAKGMTPPPVSVIVVVRENDYYFIENALPAMLNQDCEQFEVVVVDCSYSDEIGENLSEISLQYSNLHVTAIKAHGITDHSTKLALTVGIKAAKYEHLILTTSDSHPASDKWLELMSKGFITADVVLGYSGIERKRGFVNTMIRCSRLNYSVKFLSAAIKGFPYRGIGDNIGYTKSLYFGRNGFNHLNMNIGDDDLFIKEIVTSHNVSVVMNRNASTFRIQYGGFFWWSSIRRLFSVAFPYYPARAKRYVRGELWSRFIFFAAAAASIWLLGLWFMTAPIFLVLLRLYVVEIKVWRIGRRVGDRGLMWVYPIFDFVSPFNEFYLGIRRKVRKNRAVWR